MDSSSVASLGYGVWLRVHSAERFDHPTNRYGDYCSVRRIA